MICTLDASLRGHWRIKIRTNDTDVIVLALSVVSTLPVDEFWITYGSGKDVQHMPAHVVASSLGPSKASALPMFHALTGSDTVSFFLNPGKKSAWDVWNVFPELTPVLCALKASPKIIREESLAVLERLWYFSMTEKAVYWKSTKHGRSYSARNQGNLTAYRQLKQRLSSTSDEQYFRELILGAKPSCVSPHFLALQTGDGSIKHVAGHRIGWLLNKQKTPAMNLSTVDVKLHAGGDASVWRLIWCAPASAKCGGNCQQQ